jgi:PAS domain S-box-containing protein
MSRLKNAIPDTELRRFLNSLTDWVWEMDVNGIHTYSNDAVKTILGYEAEELIGRHVSMFWPEEHASPEAIEKFNIELKDGVPWRQFRGRFRHKNGEMKILESSAELLLDDQGELIGFRGVDRDIEQSIKHEKALEKSNEKYREVAEKLEWENNFKTLLLDTINHDILNPVNAIHGISDMLLTELPDNKKIQAINASSLRLIAVISNARALTQISMNEKIDLTELNLSKIVHSAKSEFENAFAGKGITTKVLIAADLTINANPIIIEVFKNYLSNALKYAEKSKQVSIVAIVEDESIMVEVKDEGKTLGPDVRMKIFERGVQLDRSQSGDGIGLAIVKRIAQAHNAEVGVRPRLLRGNAFYIKFQK